MILFLSLHLTYINIKSKNIMSLISTTDHSDISLSHMAQPVEHKPKSHERLRHCAFSNIEDQNLRDNVAQFGCDWNKVSQNMRRRSAKQCRERWNVLQKRQESARPWTPEEDQILVRKCIELGPKWALLENFFIDRNSISLKARWHKLLSQAENESMMMGQTETEKVEQALSDDSENSPLESQSKVNLIDERTEDFWNFLQFNETEVADLFPMSSGQYFSSVSGYEFDLW
ncbi:Myb-like DNA-binding domain containing protein [Tritrichomonas foetus]|uniref:Myb-like DNA-binding domain containing protein n=1 Tax=Tritrichomonas foetus TaxID=1144522 RepID=A0A1J4JFX5_9EUKA|nr:Myb-like DNA-binding domain containing protein [Tritrichomonas foetus]|eukprot:OHS96116.1 Myb-like DNA-binding domain containing protein [Tritrichomonas foetus]